MKKYFGVLRECPLFNDISDENIAAMLACLGAKSKKFKKGETVFAEGEPAKHFGVVLSGAVQIVRVDYYGNRSIIAGVEPAQIFGESFACAGLKELPVDVVAAGESEIMLIDAQRISTPCSSACSFHSRMIFNLLNITARKNLIFHQKIEVTSKRTTREKLMAFLLLQAKSVGSSTFTIPYDRQELADYLGVDRSGLSAEIGKLRHEKVLECKRSTFTLL